MKVYEVEKGSKGAEGLHRRERPEPKPGPREVLIRVRATSLNFRDQMIIKGGYPGGEVHRDLIPISDGAGEVAAVGAGVTQFKPGERVAGTFFQTWVDGAPTGPRAALGAPLDGMLAEYVALHEDGVVRIPESLSFAEAATLPCAGVTAWNALMVAGNSVKPGDTVLCLGTGGVSIFALQLARAAGARVIITSSSDEKIARAKSLGAAEGVNYKQFPDWEKEVLRLTAGRGVDHVLEVGGPGTLSRSMQSLGFGGKLALIGVLAGFVGDTNPFPLAFKGASLQGIGVGSRRMFEELNKAIETNGIKPVVDRVFPFEAAVEAFLYQGSGTLFGKVVITV